MPRFLIAALAVLTVTTTSFAQGIIAPTAGPINSSMAGASVVAPVDFGGSYWNPAIISGLPRNEFLLGSQLLIPSFHMTSSRVRGGTGRGADPPHPPLRGTFSRREKGFCPSPAGRGWPKAG